MVADAIGADGEGLEAPVGIGTHSDADSWGQNAAQAAPTVPSGAIGRSLPVVKELAAVFHDKDFLPPVLLVDNGNVVSWPQARAEAGRACPGTAALVRVVQNSIGAGNKEIQRPVGHLANGELGHLADKRRLEHGEA